MGSSLLDWITERLRDPHFRQSPWALALACLAGVILGFWVGDWLGSNARNDNDSRIGLQQTRIDNLTAEKDEAKKRAEAAEARIKSAEDQANSIRAQLSEMNQQGRQREEAAFERGKSIAEQQSKSQIEDSYEAGRNAMKKETASDVAEKMDKARSEGLAEGLQQGRSSNKDFDELADRAEKAERRVAELEGLIAQNQREHAKALKAEDSEPKQPIAELERGKRKALAPLTSEEGNVPPAMHMPNTACLRDGDEVVVYNGDVITVCDSDKIIAVEGANLRETFMTIDGKSSRLRNGASLQLDGSQCRLRGLGFISVGNRKKTKVDLKCS